MCSQKKFVSGQYLWFLLLSSSQSHFTKKTVKNKKDPSMNFKNCLVQDYSALMIRLKFRQFSRLYKDYNQTFQCELTYDQTFQTKATSDLRLYLNTYETLSTFTYDAIFFFALFFLSFQTKTVFHKKTEFITKIIRNKYLIN